MLAFSSQPIGHWKTHPHWTLVQRTKDVRGSERRQSSELCNVAEVGIFGYFFSEIGLVMRWCQFAEYRIVIAFSSYYAVDSLRNHRWKGWSWAEGYGGLLLEMRNAASLILCNIHCSCINICWDILQNLQVWSLQDLNSPTWTFLVA